MTEQKPLIGIVTCSVDEPDGLFFRTGEKYVRAINDHSHALPMLIPSLGDDLDMKSLFNRLDGILFTGSPSNVHPDLYGGLPQREGKKEDKRRDSTTMRMLDIALSSGKPIFCICRGHQELNVFLGGTLHQHIHEIEGFNDHREYMDKPLQESYAPRHGIRLTENGKLAAINNGSLDVRVNSLHWQGIDKKADDLFVEALAEDGIIEACTVVSAKGYALSVQWHPEHPTALQDSFNRAIFEDFGKAIL